LRNQTVEKTRSTLQQGRSSQLQKHQALRMSRRIAVEQRCATGMWENQGGQFEMC